MSYTTERHPQGITKDKTGFLREGMIAEIVAINDYSNFISLTNNREVKDIFYHIMDEEKIHYGMFLTALRKYDKEEDELKDEVQDHVNISNKDMGKYKDLWTAKDKNENLLISIREAIKGELEAILLYQHFLENTSDNYLIDIISRIIYDEKEHTEELTLALTLLDKSPYGLTDSE
ncbi:Rubrerythrin [Hathewaya proteolytica DSM 3090]|uniref:Rubrerythrin n=1 Tax=Hathewaya proteolytica DSM 3090 TaxID=1121331 RepID=A0A1M6MXC4_9CLOT|nr:ferritin-like domain-containing protein [Hathewaya proteolytica]SHJ88064.1 Rubrerythrin [Hathewaya proteolytica DSM 3090]